MNCSDVVRHFTDYLDGRTDEQEAAAIDAHLEGCATCGRYRNVIVHGAEVLRALPEPELHEDFGPRLRHRLFHVDDERVLAGHGASGTPAMTVLGIALLLTAVAWSPMVFSGGARSDVSPVVLDRNLTEGPFQPASSPPGTFSDKSGELDDGLWEGAVLYEYTPLSQRHDRRMRARRASQTDH